MKSWIIVNVSNLRGEYSWDAENRIPERQRPSFVHFEREAAEKELLRLALEHPGEFLLFEAVARTTKVLTRLGYVERIEPLGS